MGGFFCLLFVVCCFGDLGTVSGYVIVVRCTLDLSILVKQECGTRGFPTVYLRRPQA